MKTNMSNEQEARIHEEISIGNRAANAYNTYLKEYIEAQSKALFLKFVQPTTSIDEAIEIKRLQTSIAMLEYDIKQDIETGKLALMQLNNQEK